MSRATDATETKSLSAFVLSLSLSATKKSHVKAWEESQMQTRQHPSWFWMASTERVCAWEPCYLEQRQISSDGLLPMALLRCQDRPRRTRPDPSVQTLHVTPQLWDKRRSLFLLRRRMRPVWLANLTSVLFATALMKLKSEALTIPEFLFLETWN